MLLKGKDNKIEEKRQEGGKGGWTGEDKGERRYCTKEGRGIALCHRYVIKHHFFEWL